MTFVTLWARNKVLGLNDLHADLPTLHGTLGRAVLLACSDVPFTHETLYPTENTHET